MFVPNVVVKYSIVVRTFILKPQMATSSSTHQPTNKQTDNIICAAKFRTKHKDLSKLLVYGGTCKVTHF